MRLCIGHTKRILGSESEDVGSYLFVGLAIPFRWVGMGSRLSIAPEQPMTSLSLLPGFSYWSSSVGRRPFPSLLGRVGIVYKYILHIETLVAILLPRGGVLPREGRKVGEKTSWCQVLS